MARIGIIGALDQEIALFRESVTLKSSLRLPHEEFLCGSWGMHEVAVGKSGVGKVMASMTTQSLIDRFAPTAILFTGLCGALDSALNRGDVLVSTDCVQHDIQTQVLGFRRGEIPYTGLFNIVADSMLHSIALETLLPNGKIRAGRIISGDQFIHNAHLPEYSYLMAELGGHGVEMEGAAVATVSHFNRVPFLVIRTISDRADGSAPGDFLEFLPRAAENSLRVVATILGRMPP